MEVALYYPSIVPPLQWMKQSLLFFDKISSIVPRYYKVDKLDLPDFIDNQDNVKTLRWLERDEHWIPVKSDEVGETADQCSYEIYRVVEQLFANKVSAASKGQVITGVLLPDKLDMGVRDLMILSGLASVHDSYLEVPSQAVNAILSVVATHLVKPTSDAYGRGVRATVSTDALEYFNLVTDPFKKPSHVITQKDLKNHGMKYFIPIKKQEERTERSERYQILLNGLLPVPRRETPLEAIIGYREKHHTELLAFRKSINDMLSNALESSDPIDTIMKHRNNIQKALEDVNKSAKSRAIGFTWSAIAVATGTAATAELLGPKALEWVFAGIGVTAVIEITKRLTRYPRKTSDEPDLSYLIKSYVFTPTGKVPRKVPG
jgi:hypothetical protein